MSVKHGHDFRHGTSIWLGFIVRFGAELSSAKDTAYGLLCSITEFCDHERRAMSTDHRLDSAWFGAGAAIKQRGLEQALRMIA